MRPCGEKSARLTTYLIIKGTLPYFTPSPPSTCVTRPTPPFPKLKTSPSSLPFLLFLPYVCTCMCVCVYVCMCVCFRRKPKGTTKLDIACFEIFTPSPLHGPFSGFVEWGERGGGRRGKKLLVGWLVGCEDGWDGMGWGFLIDRSIGACLSIYLSFASFAFLLLCFS